MLGSGLGALLFAMLQGLHYDLACELVQGTGRARRSEMPEILDILWIGAALCIDGREDTQRNFHFANAPALHVGRCSSRVWT